MKQIFIILLLSCMPLFAKATEDKAGTTNQRKSYADQILSGEEYYDAALRGDLIHKEDSNNFLNFSELHFIGDFPVWDADYVEKYYYNEIVDGKISSNPTDTELSDFFKKKEKTTQEDKEGLYRDLEGNLWFVHNEGKKEEFWIRSSYYNNLTEKEKGEKFALKYIAFKVMNLLIGSWVSEVKLLKDMPGYIAVKSLSGFSKKLVRENDLFCPMRLKLEIAMDFIGLKKPHFYDHHSSNAYFIFDDFLIVTFRNGFDYALFDLDAFQQGYKYFYEGLDIETYPHVWSDLKGAKLAIESLINIEDDAFLYLLGDCYNDLLKINVNLSNELFKKLGPMLTRKRQLLEEETYKIFTILEKIETDPELFTSEDEITLQKGINISLPLYAAQRGLLNLAEFLNNNENQKNKASLLSAIPKGDLETVTLLLKEKRVNLNIRDNKGRTPLDLAFIHKQFDIAKFLLGNGADPLEWPRYISIAIEESQLDLLKLLLDKGVNPNSRPSTFDNTPIETAVRCDNLDAIKLLLDYGVNLNDESQGPLLQAIGRNNLKLVRFLLEKGANPNIRCKTYEDWSRGHTHLTLAVTKNRLEIVKLLLANGADPNLAKPLDSAVGDDNLELVRLLIEKGANPNGQYYEEWYTWNTQHTCWNADILKNRLEIVKLLSENGANPNLANDFGKKALDIALRLNNSEMAQLLNEYLKLEL